MVHTLGEDVMRSSFNKNVSSVPIVDRNDINGELKLEIAKEAGPFLVSIRPALYLVRENNLMICFDACS
jgi:hypothetical protein